MSKAHSIVGVSEGRDTNDFYVTPSETIKAILQAEPMVGTIWEPSCGTGAISEELIAHGYESVVSSDLIDRGYGVGSVNFLKTNLNVDNVITNPPFSLAREFVDHALKCASQKVIMLAKIQFLAGQKRHFLFQDPAFKGIYVCKKRLKMKRAYEEKAYKNGGMMDFAWFVWDKQTKEHSPTIKWL